MFGKLSFVPTANGGLEVDGSIEDASLLALRQARVTLASWMASMNATLAGRRAENPSATLTDVERANLHAVTGFASVVNLALAEREAANEADRSAPDPGAGGDAAASAAAAARAGLSVADDGGSRQRVTAWRRGTPFFGAQAAADLGGFTSSREYLHAVAHGLAHPAMRAESQSGNTGSGGGFAIPGALWNQILMTAVESSIVMGRAQAYPMTTRELDVPAWDDLDRTGGAIAGLSLQMTGESGTVDQQVAKLRTMKLRARKGMLLVSAPNELLADAPTFQGGLERLMATALSFGFDYRFLFGDGSNGPLGCLVAPCTITVNRGTANRIQYDDLTSMFSRLTPASVQRSVWVANSACIPQLASLSVVVGTGGSHVPVMTQNDGRFFILTREVLFTEKVPTLGTQSDISLCDFGSYAWGARQNAALERSMHVGFTTDEQMFRLAARFDGQPTLSSAITPMNGSTMSPFVTLGDPA